MQVEVLQRGRVRRHCRRGKGRVLYGGGGALQDNGRNGGELDVLDAGYEAMWVNWVYPP
jgi:hypothetical protein